MIFTWQTIEQGKPSGANHAHAASFMPSLPLSHPGFNPAGYQGEERPGMTTGEMEIV
jgi:hypothetical protein